MTTNDTILERNLGRVLDSIASAAYTLTVNHSDDEAALDALRALAYALGHTVNAIKKTKHLGEG